MEGVDGEPVPQPTHLPHHWAGSKGGHPQVGFVFASNAIADRATIQALNHQVKESGPSDHCRFAIGFAS